jgi:hypothetical protein
MAETLKQPTRAQVDGLVKRYAEAKAEADAIGAVLKMKSAAADKIKAELVELVETFGFRHTQKSKRLAGDHSHATTTKATRVTIDDAAVETFRSYLAERELTEISGRFFVEHVSYSLVEGPQEVLKTLSLGKRIREKVESLLGLCFKIKTNAPSLTIETVTPACPDRRGSTGISLPMCRRRSGSRSCGSKT